MFRNLFRRLVDKIVQPDPRPEYSRLDRMDGRGTVAMDDEVEARVDAAMENTVVWMMSDDDPDEAIARQREQVRAAVRRGLATRARFSDDTAAHYARVTEVQKRSAWS